jgi:hypothetical protein
MQNTYTQIYLTAYRWCINYRHYRITLRVNIFTQIGSDVKCWLDIHHWGAGLAVTERTRDIGRKVLQSPFPTEVSAAPVTDTFSSLSYSSTRLIRNTWTITISSIDNHAVIYTYSNYGELWHLILFIKIPLGMRKIFFEIYRQFECTPSKNVRPAIKFNCYECFKLKKKVVTFRIL